MTIETISTDVNLNPIRTMKAYRKLLIASFAMLAGNFVHAVELHDWQFNDPVGTPVSATVNQGINASFWDGNLANSQTTGDGVLRIQRSGGLTSRRANIGDNQGSLEMFLYGKIAGWNFTGVLDGSINNPEPHFRFEMLDGFAEDNTTSTTAGVRLEWQEDGQVALQAFASGTAAPGGTASEFVPLFGSVQEEPVELLVWFHRLFFVYTVEYRIGDGPWTFFYEGTTSGVRDVDSFRLAVRGDIAGDGNGYFDLDRFVIATDFPISEADDPPTEPDTPFVGILHDFHFNEPEGTSMEDTVNNGFNVGYWDFRWDGNLAASATTGDGKFRIQRDGSLTSRRMDVGRLYDAEVLYMAVDIAGWDFSSLTGSDDQPHLRFEFLDGTAESETTSATAGMRLNREENGDITLEAVAGGTADPGSETKDPEVIPAFSSLQQEPVFLLLEYNRVAHWYRISYRVGDGEPQEFFHGNTSGVRDAVSLRLAVRGNFAGDGSGYFDLNRFTVSNVYPFDVGLWDNIPYMSGSAYKWTSIGPISDTHYPHVFHADASEWFQVFTNESVLTDGVVGYLPALDKWFWTNDVAGKWIHVFTEPGGGWTKWSDLD